MKMISVEWIILINNSLSIQHYIFFFGQGNRFEEKKTSEPEVKKKSSEPEVKNRKKMKEKNSKIFF